MGLNGIIGKLRGFMEMIEMQLGKTQGGESVIFQTYSVNTAMDGGCLSYRRFRP